MQLWRYWNGGSSKHIRMILKLNIMVAVGK